MVYKYTITNIGEIQVDKKRIPMVLFSHNKKLHNWTNKNNRKVLYSSVSIPLSKIVSCDNKKAVKNQ